MRENKVAYEDISDINPAQIINNRLNSKVGKTRRNTNKKNKAVVSNKRNITKDLKTYTKLEEDD